MKDKKRGALLGLAIGDALGAAVEFQDRGTFEPVIGYRGGGLHLCCKAGDWTDDTSMALALGDSIGEVGWKLKDQMKRYAEWMEKGKYTIPGYCFDIGNTTQRAIFKFIQDQTNPLCGLRDHSFSGNGSIMRLAPVPIFYADLYSDQIQKLLWLAYQSSSTTHASDACIFSCGYMTLIMSAFINGKTKEEVLNSKFYNPESASYLASIYQCEYKNKIKDQIRGSGYVVESLEAALWCFWHSNSFEEAVLMAVNLGDDADTTGAVCGQIAGAYYGESGIPKHLLDGLNGKEMIEKVLEKI